MPFLLSQNLIYLLQNPCQLDLTRFGECGKFPYGYNKDNLNPCFILKVNKIFNFVPEVYDEGDEELKELEKVNLIFDCCKQSLTRLKHPPTKNHTFLHKKEQLAIYCIQ